MLIVPLPERHQRSDGSICMVRGIELDAIERDVSFRPPRYF